MGHQCFFLMNFSLERIKGEKAIKEIKILKTATCLGVRPIKDFLIRMKLLPQTRLRNIKIIHAKPLV
jgi:hypothetical protein